MKKFLLMLLCGLGLSLASTAQTAPSTPLKLGYIDSRVLLQQMPDVVKADTALKIYARTYQDQLETMSREFEKKMADYQKNGQTMTEAVREVRERELQDLQQRFQTTQQSATEKVERKKEELYKPILDKADKAIKEVARERGYDYVFDASGGMLLFAKESEDILPLVKVKLGIR